MTGRTSLRRLVTGGVVVGLVLLAVVLLLSLAAERSMQDATAAEARRSESLRLAYELRQTSDDLTRMARSYVATGRAALPRLVPRDPGHPGRHRAPPGGLRRDLLGHRQRHRRRTPLDRGRRRSARRRRSRPSPRGPGSAPTNWRCSPPPRPARTRWRRWSRRRSRWSRRTARRRDRTATRPPRCSTTSGTCTPRPRSWSPSARCWPRSTPGPPQETAEAYGLGADLERRGHRGRRGAAGGHGGVRGGDPPGRAPPGRRPRRRHRPHRRPGADAAGTAPDGPTSAPRSPG